MYLEHTPGPWKFRKHPDGNWYLGSDFNDEPVAIARMVGDGAEPNAKLIAASPEILEALGQVMHLALQSPMLRSQGPIEDALNLLIRLDKTDGPEGE